MRRLNPERDKIEERLNEIEKGLKLIVFRLNHLHVRLNSIESKPKPEKELIPPKTDL